MRKSRVKPAWPTVIGRIVRQVALVLAIRIHNVDFIVPIPIGAEGNLRLLWRLRPDAY
jgi:hypothetical protein